MENKPILFGTDNILHLKWDYPLLQNIEEFQYLSDKELAFVWYMSCKSSPIYGISKTDKVNEAFKLVEGFAKSLGTEYKEYVSGHFPGHIRDAMKVMESFEPEIRYKVMMIINRIMENIFYVSTLKAESYAHDSLSDLKIFMDMQFSIAKGLPSILEMYEHGFGYKKKQSSRLQMTILEEL